MFDIPRLDVIHTPAVDIPRLDVMHTPAVDVPRLDVIHTPAVDIPRLDVIHTPAVAHNFRRFKQISNVCDPFVLEHSRIIDSQCKSHSKKVQEEPKCQAYTLQNDSRVR